LFRIEKDERVVSVAHLSEVNDGEDDDDDDEEKDADTSAKKISGDSPVGSEEE
jgi:hypothetical protein